MKKEILFSEEEIQDRVGEIAEILNENFQDRNPVIIGLLTGSFMFCADLLRKLNFPFNFEFLQASSYLNSNVSSGEVEVEEIGFGVKGRDVILVDDILDSGNTLEALIEKLNQEGAKSITSIMMFNKTARREKDVKADIVGFDVDNHYLVGYGMDDDKGQGRSYPFVFKIEEE